MRRVVEYLKPKSWTAIMSFGPHNGPKSILVQHPHGWPCAVLSDLRIYDAATLLGLSILY